MNDWCASQLPEIAKRVLAEEQDGRPVDPYRKAWADWVLEFSDEQDTPARAFAQPAKPVAQPSPQADDVPAWVTEDQQEPQQ